MLAKVNPEVAGATEKRYRAFAVGSNPRYPHTVGGSREGTRLATGVSGLPAVVETKRGLP